MAHGDRSNKNTITLKTTRCLHGRSSWSACSLCVDSCPGEAIEFPAPGKIPTINHAKCMQCGQCLTACPVEAIESSTFSERRLVERMKDKEQLHIRCFLPYGYLDSLEKMADCYQLGACLASLSPGVFFELALTRECEIITDYCQKCTLFKRLKPTLQENVSAAFLLLRSINKAGNFKESTPLFLPQLESTRIDRGELEHEQDHMMSIRSLFASSRTSTNRQKPERLSLKETPKHVPQWRVRTKNLWERYCYSSDTICTYKWPALELDEEHCRACGVCMQLCPTGTIRFNMANGVFTQASVPGNCCDCGLCISVCPEAALSRSYRAFSRPFEESTIREIPAHSCEKCKMPIINNPSARLCPICETIAQRKPLVYEIREQLQEKLKQHSSAQQQKPQCAHDQK